MNRLEGRVVLITGAGRGLGHGVARGLVRYGATVIGVSRTVSELEALAAEIREAGGEIDTPSVDLSQPAEIEALAQRVIERYGRLDALINNAAILRNRPFLDLTAEEFDETIEVNLMAPVRLIRAFLPTMLAQGHGAIINVSSRAGIQPFENETDYCAAKYGLEGFSFSLAIELQPKNISVNVVSPGYRIKPTSVTAEEFARWPEERRAEYRDPIDMADAFAYLAVQDGSGVTGQRFNAFDLAERVRQEGWDWTPTPAPSDAERA
ncbi:MAG: SDR family oxidoreductase [Sphaerobacter sp.]|nr:SDR family oxidoreductase [Sphaerobacter sp.]